MAELMVFHSGQITPCGIDVNLYCWQHKANHVMEVHDVEQLVYALTVGYADAITTTDDRRFPDDAYSDHLPCPLAVAKQWASDPEIYAEHVEQEVECRASAQEGLRRSCGCPTPERHRDGPDQGEADLPDPNANTFDAKADS
jgi:hypothetical protein